VNPALRKLKNPGKNISTPEITHISEHGFCLIANDREYFLPFADFPWFENATIQTIHDFKLIGDRHLRWEKLDVDLDLYSLENLEKYPLIYK